MAPRPDPIAIAQKVLMELIEYKNLDPAEVEFLRSVLPQAGKVLSAYELACTVINKSLLDRAKLQNILFLIERPYPREANREFCSYCFRAFRKHIVKRAALDEVPSDPCR